MTEFLPFANDAVELFGIAIKAFAPPVSQRHVGVLYRGVDGQVNFLHLAWHNRLVCGSCDGSYHWAETGFDHYNRLMLAEFASIVAAKHVGKLMPYGFGYQGEEPAPFGGDGEWDSVKSMTCSTFVLAMFVAFGHPIVDVETWPSREADRQWAESMLVNHLVQICSPSDVEHLQTLISSCSYVRVRPEETAIAARGPADELPYVFSKIDRPSRELVRQLEIHASAIQQQDH